MARVATWQQRLRRRFGQCTVDQGSYTFEHTGLRPSSLGQTARRTGLDYPPVGEDALLTFKGIAQVVTLVHDLDGSTEDVQTYSFAFLKRSYEIDLSAKNFDNFAKLFQPYIDAGRMPTGASSARSSNTAAAGKAARIVSDRDYDLADLRAWAAKNEIVIPARGRVPLQIVQQYKASGSIGKI